MDDRRSRQIAAIADISLIVVAVVFGTLAMKTMLESREARQLGSARSRSGFVAPGVGARFHLPGIDWTAGTHTLVLVLSTTCHFCSDSAPFYRRLLDQARKEAGWRTIAVLPQPSDDARPYLLGLGIAADQILQASLASLGTGGTPTLVVVDSEGVVTASWFGRLSNAAETEVLALFRTISKKEE